MNAMANQRCSETAVFCCLLRALADWIQLSEEFSQRKQQSADVRVI